MQKTFAFLFLLLTALAAPSRTPLAQQPVPVVDASALGDRIDLKDGWLFRAGDDPAWASPTLDDHDWTSVNVFRELSEYGVPPDTRFGWMRIHIRLRPAAPPPVFGALWTYGRFQVFANGRLLGTVGDMGRHTYYEHDSLSQFPIPAGALSQATSGGSDLVIAVRCSLQTVTYGAPAPLATFLHGEVFLGTSRALTETATSFKVLKIVPVGIDLVPSLVVAFFALALFLAVRNRPEYLLLSVYCLLTAASIIYGYHSWTVPYEVTNLSAQAVLYCVQTFALLAFVSTLHRRTSLRPFFALAMLGIVSSASIPLWAAGMVPSWGSEVDIIGTAFIFGGALVLLLHAVRKAEAAYRKDLLPVLIGLFVNMLAFCWTSLTHIGSLASLQLFTPSVRVGPFLVDGTDLADVIFTALLLIFLILRTVRIARERNRAAAEVEAAQTVQKLLLSRSSVPTPGFTVESIYRPATEVGGDFFLISPSAHDGSLVAVVGDVSGKGLSAAMNVSMILGVLRNEASRDPAQVLEHLNDSLVAQGAAGFTTACCVHLTTKGEYTIANAGHIAPYLSGVELDTAPSIPLGLASSQQYDTTTGRIIAGDQLTLLTDGIPEARAKDGTLLGFEPLNTLTRAAAASIADAAQTFGQEDDITVLTIALQV